MKTLSMEQAVIISGYTGVLICPFQNLHGDVERRLGRPIFTSEFLHIEKELKDAYRSDFLALHPASED